MNQIKSNDIKKITENLMSLMCETFKHFKYIQTGIFKRNFNQNNQLNIMLIVYT